MSAILASLLVATASALPAQTATLFQFRSAFWVNLHHYLHAVGRNESPLREELPSAATAAEREDWRAAVSSYRSRYGGAVVLFDPPLIDLKTRLIAAPSEQSLRGSAVRPQDASVLEAAAGIYRRHVWLEHDGANTRFVALVQPLLARYGDVLASEVARSFDATWPANGIRADLVHAIQPGATAYTTNNPTHITVEVSDPRNAGLAGLEMLFHEASHGWGVLIRNELGEAARRTRLEVPRDLPHAVITYNAGEITRRVLADAGVSGYRLYMDAEAIFGSFRHALGSHWPAFLDGRITRKEALRRILLDTAPERRPGA